MVINCKVGQTPSDVKFENIQQKWMKFIMNCLNNQVGSKMQYHGFAQPNAVQVQTEYPDSWNETLIKIEKLNIILYASKSKMGTTRPLHNDRLLVVKLMLMLTRTRHQQKAIHEEKNTKKNKNRGERRRRNKPMQRSEPNNAK